MIKTTYKLRRVKTTLLPGTQVVSRPSHPNGYFCLPADADPENGYGGDWASGYKWVRSITLPTQAPVATERVLASFTRVLSINSSAPDPDATSGSAALVTLKKREQPRRPKVPVFRPPRLISLKKPQLRLLKEPRKRLPLWREPKKVTTRSMFRKRKFDLRYEAALSRYKDRVIRIQKLNVARREQYEKLLALYEKRVARYQAKYKQRLAVYHKQLARYRDLLESWKQRSKGVSVKRYKPWVWHPYERVIVRLDRGSGPFRVEEFWSHQNFPVYRDGETEQDYSLGGSDVYLAKSWQPGMNLDPVAAAFHSEMLAIGNEMISHKEAKLVRTLYSRLSDEQVHVGNMLAERHQTIKMFYDCFGAIADFILTKGKSALRLTSVRKNADIFLAWQFGLSPLIDDLRKFAQLLTEAPDISLTVKSTSKQRVFSTHDNGRYSFQGVVTCRYVLEGPLDGLSYRTLQQFGLLNPGTVLWEVTPWSFVVDWVLPVGSFLTALSSTLQLDYMNTNVSRSIHMDGTFTGKGLYPIKGIVSLDDRKIVVPPDLAQILRVKNPLSWVHGFEALALVVQKIKAFK